MDLLFMNNGLPTYGIPRSGLVSIIDPWRDTYGRNILPVGSENFQTGWSVYNSATVNVYAWDDATYPAGLDPKGGHNAYRIRTSGGTDVMKYYCHAAIGISGVNYCTQVKIKNNAATTVKIYQQCNNAEKISVTQAEGWKTAYLPGTYVAGSIQIRIDAGSAADALDFTVYQPQININSLYPYAPPSGLPQSLTDYSQRGNNAQLGSTSGSDTNDPSYSGAGLVFGTDDYCKSSASVFDDMPAFTCITVCKANSLGGSSGGRIYDKGTTRFAVNTGNTIIFAQELSDGVASWVSSGAFTLGSNMIISLSYNRTTPAVIPTMDINNVKCNSTTQVSYTGNALTNASNDLYVGNRATADRYFDGNLYLQLWYNRILSDAEYMSAYNGLKRLMNARGVVI